MATFFSSRVPLKGAEARGVYRYEIRTPDTSGISVMMENTMYIDAEASVNDEASRSIGLYEGRP